MKISSIIPCHSSHVSKLQNLVSNLNENQTKKPDEIIIVVNPRVEVKINSSIPLKIIYENRCTPGRARNLGAEVAEGDLLIFFDADDFYHKNRIEIIDMCFSSTEAAAAVHGYVHHDASILSNDIIMPPSFSEATADSNNNTNLAEPTSNFPIHHGHASFKKSIFKQFKYREDLVPGEDGELLRRVCATGNKVMCILEKLSVYAPSNSWR